MTIRSGALSHATSTANAGQLNPVAKPLGMVDGDVMVAFVIVPTVAATSSVITAPGGFGTVRHFHAPAAAAVGLSVGITFKPVPSVAAEVATEYSFGATNIASSARPLVIIQVLSGRDLENPDSGPANSASRSSSTTAVTTGEINPTGDDWDILYLAATRSNNTFVGTDAELDDYNPATNTSAALYGLSNQAAGAYSKTVTAGAPGGASSVGLGVIVAVPKFIEPAVISPIKRIVGGVPVPVDAYRITGGVPVRLSPVS